MTAVAPWGENSEDAYDQGLVELGLGDTRLIEAKGAMLPLNFEATPPRPLPMGTLVECHMATSYAFDGASACAGVAWASCVTPEGDECAIVATISTDLDYEETSLLLRRNLQRRLATRDLEVISFDVAVDEVTAGSGHHGVAMAALIMPNSLTIGGRQSTGPIRGGLTVPEEKQQKRVDVKAPAAPALRPGSRRGGGKASWLRFGRYSNVQPVECVTGENQQDTNVPTAGNESMTLPQSLTRHRIPVNYDVRYYFRTPHLNYENHSLRGYLSLNH